MVNDETGTSSNHQQSGESNQKHKKKKYPVAVSIFLLTLLTFFIFISIFIPADSFNYPEAWTFICLFVIFSFSLAVYFMLSAPELITSRIMRKKSSSQIIIQLINIILFFSIFLVAGYSKKHNAFEMPIYYYPIGTMLFCIACYLVFKVFSENEYLANNISVEQGQRVIDTGLYSVVRHPLYSAILLFLITIPLILRSFLSFIPVFAIAFGILLRALDEERFLKKNLAGYAEYCKKVKYRFCPKIL